MTAVARLALPGLGLLLAAGLLTLVAWPPTTHATPPQEFQDLAEHCRTFTKMKAYITVNTHLMLFHAVDDGRWAADVYNQTRYSWDGTTLLWDSESGPPIQVGGDAAPIIISDLWNDCRSGFSGATWTDVTAQRHDLAAGRLRGANMWARLDLPDAWAQGAEIYVGVVPGSGLLQRVYFRPPGGDWNGRMRGGWWVIGVGEQDWNTDFPPQALLPDAPPFTPPLPADWGPPPPVPVGPNEIQDISELVGQ